MRHAYTRLDFNGAPRLLVKQRQTHSHQQHVTHARIHFLDDTCTLDCIQCDVLLRKHKRLRYFDKSCIVAAKLIARSFHEIVFVVVIHIYHKRLKNFCKRPNRCQKNSVPQSRSGLETRKLRFHENRGHTQQRVRLQRITQ